MFGYASLDTLKLAREFLRALITIHDFLTGFNSVPHKAEHSWKFFRRVKRRLVRTWYWLLAITFLVTSALAISVTFRIVSIWVRDYLSGQ